MSIKKMPIGLFVAELEKALNRKDGYIMGATGQDPKKWSKTSWWFTQYSGSQKTKALYWRENAARVWDCNGLAEGIYKDWSGVDINTKARYNYSQWCEPKGKGMIPAKYRVPGAAVFTGASASTIPHIMYLYKPVVAGKPEGDWYLIEARGVNYGVVKTKLYSRKPTFWGLMTKYFDYDNTATSVTPERYYKLGDRLLKRTSPIMEGVDVEELQTYLNKLGFDCGAIDGEYGKNTEKAVKEFQAANGCEADGEYGSISHKAMLAALSANKTVQIVNGNCHVRAEATKESKSLGVAHNGDTLPYTGETAANGWNGVEYKGVKAWVSGLYSKLV